MLGIIGVDYDSKAVHLALLCEWETGIHLSVFRVHFTTLSETLRDLVALLDRIRPNSAVVEAPIYIQNPKTSFLLSRMHTLICLACEQANLPFITLGSARWKKLAFGSARLNKRAVFERARESWKDLISDHHYADAYGLALAGMVLHATRGKEETMSEVP